MCWECIHSMREHASLAITLVGLCMSSLYVLWSCKSVWILVRYSLVFNMQMTPILSHGLTAMGWLFLRLLNAVSFFNVRLL